MMSVTPHRRYADAYSLVPKSHGSRAAKEEGTMKTNRTWIAAAGLCVLGCAHSPAPTEQVASSLAAVRAAEEAGAREIPAAALHVKLAEEQLEQARSLIEQDRNQKAKDRATRSRNDAELALSLAHEQAKKKELEEFRRAHPNAGQPEQQGDVR